MIAKTQEMLIKLIFNVGWEKQKSFRQKSAGYTEAAERKKLLISTFPGCERTLLPGDLQGQTDQNTMIRSTIYRYININKEHILVTPGDETKQTDKH